MTIHRRTNPQRSCRRRCCFTTALAASNHNKNHNDNDPISIQRQTKQSSSDSPTTHKKAKVKAATTRKKTSKTTDKAKLSKLEAPCLGRTRELALLQGPLSSSSSLVVDTNNSCTIDFVVGVDEAGRGPLAGPVVAAAAMVPTNLLGITDSKALTDESDRQVLYQRIIHSPNVQWAVAVVNAQTIDDINILQATLLAMTMAVQAIVGTHTLRVEPKACTSIHGNYVVKGQTDANGQPITQKKHVVKKNDTNIPHAHNTFALIDGNRLPPNLPCLGETMVKGDSREYCIAAASILAKVTRDLLMHDYAKLYPHYNLHQHKGYPTAAHMAAVYQHGASPIHRRTFAPLKHMELDVNGKIIKS